MPESSEPPHGHHRAPRNPWQPQREAAWADPARRRRRALKSLALLGLVVASLHVALLGQFSLSASNPALFVAAAAPAPSKPMAFTVTPAPDAKRTPQPARAASPRATGSRLSTVERAAPELAEASPAEAPASSPNSEAPPEPTSPARALENSALIGSDADQASTDITEVASGPTESGAPAPTAASAAAPSPTGLAWRTPEPTRLTYDVTGRSGSRSWEARGDLLWQHQGDRYEAQLEVRAFLLGRRSQVSTGRIGPQGLEPERFADRSRQELAAHFMPATASRAAHVVFSANTPDATLVAGAQDRLSVLLQLAGWADAQPQLLQPGMSLSVQTVGAREAQSWTFVVDGLQDIDLPGGRLQAWKLTRQPRREYDQRVEIWLAPQLQHLPARVLITQTSGDLVDQQWRSSAKP